MNGWMNSWMDGQPTCATNKYIIAAVFDDVVGGLAVDAVGRPSTAE
jgi:hypothetical protein